ncbi:MAG: hypothetical protein KAT68_12215 [Bacteroidales bacterium]|nr:hypothetical protein [Bacteroidales bacterium]
MYLSKQKILLVSIILIAFILLNSCGSPSGGDNEPNNTIEQAVEITLGKAFSSSINPLGDYDWFKTEISEQGYLKVSGNEIPEGLTIEIAYFLYQEWEGEKQKRVRGWRELPNALFIAEKGTYYFALHDNYDDQFSEQAFKIKVDFLKEFDPTEPNNNPKEAKQIEFDSDLIVATYPVGDYDFLKVKAEKQGYITVKSKDVPEGITPEVKFCTFDEWSEPKLKTIRNWNELPTACFIPEAGEYYLIFHDNYDDACSENPYKLKISFLDEMDIYEPNDNFNLAKEINIGDTISPAIFPKGDNDYFKLNMAESGKIKFLVKDFENITPEIRLFVINEDNPNELKDYSDWKEIPAEFDVEGEKEYYILLHDNYDDQCSPNVFQIILN